MASISVETMSNLLCLLSFWSAISTYLYRTIKKNVWRTYTALYVQLFNQNRQRLQRVWTKTWKQSLTYPGLLIAKITWKY